MSIIDEIVSIATYYVHYHVISDWNTSVLRYTKPGKWLSGQTSRGGCDLGCIRLPLPHGAPADGESGQDPTPILECGLS